MTERLREVADLPLRFGVVLLGQEADVVSKRQQALEERSRVLQAARESVVGGKPEAAGHEGALALGKPVDGVRITGRRVAVDEPAMAELSLDGSHSAEHALVARREKAEERQQQSGGVELR